MRKLVYYVSGHGYGHASRASVVMQALLRRRPDWRIVVRTIAPPAFFRDLTPGVARIDAVSVDPGVVEGADSLEIDAQKTARGLESFLARRHSIVDAESEFLRAHDISLILADVPFLAGHISAATGIPCLAISNFTWGWIYQPLLAKTPGASRWLDIVRQGYASMHALLQLPFGHPVDDVARVIPVPLVAQRPRLDVDQTEDALGIRGDRRPRVLLGMRDNVYAPMLQQAAAAAGDYLFLSPHRLSGEKPENLRPIDQAGVTFPDVLQISDVVFTKLGYSTVAEAIAMGTRILWPARQGFREDTILRAEAPRYVPMHEIALGDFRSGHWSYALDALMRMPAPREALAIDGDDRCAQFIADFAERRPHAA